MKLLPLSLALLLVGCPRPSPPNGAITCASNGACPDGYVCDSLSNTCFQIGQLPAHDFGSSDGNEGNDASSLASNGTACATDADCASTHCADGVCCDGACGGTCSACNLPGTLGLCTPVPVGKAPSAGHGACGPDDVSTCMRDGKCDGKGNCEQWSNTTVCKPSSCVSSTNQYTPASTCDGAGACKTPAAITCAPYVCKDAQTCFSSCTLTSQCLSPNACTSGSCGPKPIGAMCSSDGECASTHCADGVCCDKACTGQCEACQVNGKVGTCSPVTGTPVAPRTPCATDGTVCGGSCDGTNRTACVYPTNTTKCGNPSCSGANLIQPLCNGSGTCVGSTRSCGNYACNTTAAPQACYSGACTDVSQCASGNDCCRLTQLSGYACWPKGSSPSCM